MNWLNMNVRRLLGSLLVIVIFSVAGMVLMSQSSFKLVVPKPRFIANVSHAARLCQNATIINLTKTTTSETKILHEITFLKEPKLSCLCWKSPCNKNVDVAWKMMFFIKSTAVHVSLRQQFRDRWGSLTFLNGAQFGYIFIIGKHDSRNQKLVDEEDEKYGDLLQLDLPEKYGFVYKKTLGGMKWADENLSENEFYTSCDDDVTFDFSGIVGTVNKFRDFVADRKWPEFPILCTYKTRIADGPDRHERSKYYLSRDKYKWPNFPDYCLGGAYTTSVSVARQLWTVSQSEKAIEMDDVWITGILRSKLMIPRQYIKEINPPLAFHHVGFRGKNEQERGEFLDDEWNKAKKSFDGLPWCSCEKENRKI